MNKSKAALLFVAGIALFLGLSVGYVLRSWWSVSRTVKEQPKIFGMGTELIDRPSDPQGVPFELTSVFAFTDDFFHCVVVTNDKPFAMKTYSLGTVKIGKNQFSMSVDSVRIESVKNTGRGRVELKGIARSITRVGEKYEEAIVPFSAVAVDGGPGYKKDSLVLTVFYNQKDSPMQFAIFGPEPRFGQPVNILSGNISVAES